MDYQIHCDYLYDGPVVVFDKCVCHRIIMTTRAPSERKARNNLAFRYKKDTGLSPSAKVTLPGKLTRRY